MSSQTEPLTEAQKEHFLKHGYIRLSNCFTREQAAEMTEGVWTRLGMNPDDKTTWDRERINMPSHRTFDCAEFAPRAWSAICELCGGEDRIAPDPSRHWRDSLIVNLGTPETEARGQATPPQQLQGWHVDGDFFVHYLDSAEQALLVIPLLTDIPPGGGGTLLCPAAIPAVARWLLEHPEGVSPRMVPRGRADFGAERNLGWFNEVAARVPDEGFVEATGRVGDVYLLHPLMLHSAASNPLRNVRIITNPPVSLREPHCFDRADAAEYSLVERKTLGCLGVEGLPGWRIGAPREGVVPERIRVQEAMRREEILRMEGGKGGLGAVVTA